MEEITTGINNVCILVFGMCAAVPFVIDIHVCRCCEDKSTTGATLISGVILSFSPQGHTGKRALRGSTAGQHTAESPIYSCHAATRAPWSE